MSKYLALAVFIGLSELAGIIGSIFTVRAIPLWYEFLSKPSFNPPSWVFGPTWIALYALMGVAAFLVWQKLGTSPLARPALILFFVHLLVNGLWSVFFFGLQNPLLALVDIVLLWLMIALLIVLFYGIDKRAAYLLIPYILWVSFASVLNYSIWRLN